LSGVARGIVSSEYSEVRLAMSPGGKLVLWGSRNRPGLGGTNVWLSRRTVDGWSPPEVAPFNSDADDYDPAFSPDGARVYSPRPDSAALAAPASIACRSWARASAPSSTSAPR
jgi:hypothetical protein